MCGQIYLMERPFRQFGYSNDMDEESLKNADVYEGPSLLRVPTY